MKTILKVLFAASLTVSLAGCSTLGRVAEAVGVDVIPASVQQKALKSAYVAFTAWSSIQDGILIYGHLPPCKTGGPIVCRSSKAWPKIQQIEKQTTAYILATRPIIEAGSNDVEVLLSVSEVVYNAKALIEDAKSEKD